MRELKTRYLCLNLYAEHEGLFLPKGRFQATVQSADAIHLMVSKWSYQRRSWHGNIFKSGTISVQHAII